MVTEESLSQLFSKFGVVRDVSIKKSTIEPDVGRQCGYGFVHFDVTQEGVESAVLAAKTLQDTTIEEVNYKSSISHNLSKLIHGEESPSPQILNSNVHHESAPISSQQSIQSTPSMGHMPLSAIPSLPQVMLSPNSSAEGCEYQFSKTISNHSIDQPPAHTSSQITYNSTNNRVLVPNSNIGGIPHNMTSTMMHQVTAPVFRQPVYLTQMSGTSHIPNQSSIPVSVSMHSMQISHNPNPAHSNQQSGHINHPDSFVPLNQLNEMNQSQIIGQVHVMTAGSPHSQQKGVLAATSSFVPSNHQGNPNYAVHGSQGIVGGMTQNGQQGLPPSTVQPMQIGPVLIPVLSHPSNNGLPMSPIAMGSFVPTSPVHVITGPAPPPPGVTAWVPSPIMSPSITGISNDSIRDEHVSYFNVGQLLHSPNPGNSIPAYVSSPVMSNGSPLMTYTALLPPTYTAPDGQNNQAWDNWNRASQSPTQLSRVTTGYTPTYAHIETGVAAKNRHANQLSPGTSSSELAGSPAIGNGSSSFNRDVLMSSAAVKNSKSASKSGVSTRSIINRFRKNLSLPADNQRYDGKSELDEN